MHSQLSTNLYTSFVCRLESGSVAPSNELSKCGLLLRCSIPSASPSWLARSSCTSCSCRSAVRSSSIPPGDTPTGLMVGSTSTSRTPLGCKSKGYNATTDKNDATPSMSDAMRQQEIVDGNTTVCTHCNLEGHTRLPLAGGLEEDCPPRAPISEEGQPDGAAVPPALPQGRDQLGSTNTTTAGRVGHHVVGQDHLMATHTTHPVTSCPHPPKPHPHITTTTHHTRCVRHLPLVLSLLPV